MAHVLEKELKFTRSKKEPCIFYQNNKLGEIVICLCVNNNGMFLDEAAIQDTVKGLQKFFTVKVTDLENYPR